MTCQVTPNGYTIERAIQSGVDNQDSGVGLYAGDEDCYTVFAPLYDAVIEDYHGGYKVCFVIFGRVELGCCLSLPDIDIAREFQYFNENKTAQLCVAH